MKRYLACLGVVAVMGPGRCPVTPPVPVPVETMAVHVQVNAAETGAAVEGATVSIQTALPDTWLGGVTSDSGHLVFLVPASLVNSHLRVSAPGRVSYDQSVLVSRDATLTVSLARPPPALPRLHVEGRHFRRDDGTRFAWRGLTAFRLAEMVAHGRESEAVALLDWAKTHGVTVVRVLVMKAWDPSPDTKRYGQLFELKPADGLMALPRLLELAETRGLYVEVVALADTSAWPTLDLEAHVSAVGQVCAASPACLIEVINEPDHPVNSEPTRDPATLLRLRSLVPPGVLVALGAAHGSDDESDAYNGGDYITTHADRQDGERGWRATRHVKDSVRDKSERAGKPVVDDEPAKDLDVAHWRTKGLLARVLPAPGAFHYQDGLLSLPPTGLALTAFQAWQDGLDALPADLEETSHFQNTGWAASPVKAADFSKVLRVYSALGTGWCYSVLIDPVGDPALELREGWTVTSKAGPLWRLAR